MNSLYRLFLLAGLSFCVMPLSFSQVLPQDLAMKVTPNPVVKGGKFTIDFSIDYDDMAKISITPPELPVGINLTRGPYKIPVWIKLADGSNRKKINVTYTYSTNKTGRFVLGSYSVTAGTLVFITKPVIVRVGLYKNRSFYMPYNIEWSFDTGVFYEGQAIPLILEVKDLEEVMIFKDVVVSPPNKGFMEPVKNLGFVSERHVGDYSLYTVPVRGYIFTPVAVGKFKIPPASVAARGIKSVSDSLYLTALKIPDQIKATGAIGNLKISYWLENGELNRNEKIVLHVKVEGTGNLNYFQLQEPSGAGLTLITTIDASDYEPSINGYTGYRETVYSFISNSSGNKELIVPPFPFLDPESSGIARGGRDMFFYILLQI